MAWQLRWGAHAKVLEERARRTGKVTPALKARPRIRVTDVPFSDAFYQLNQARVYGHAAPNPIAVSEIAAYCSMQGIASQGERSKYLRLIQLLDQVYLTHWAEKNPSSTP